MSILIRTPDFCTVFFYLKIIDKDRVETVTSYYLRLGVNYFATIHFINSDRIGTFCNNNRCTDFKSLFYWEDLNKRYTHIQTSLE